MPFQRAKWSAVGDWIRDRAGEALSRPCENIARILWDNVDMLPWVDEPKPIDYDGVCGDSRGRRMGEVLFSKGVGVSRHVELNADFSMQS